MRYFGIVMMLFLLTACKQTPGEKAGPNGEDIEQEQGAPEDQDKGQMDPAIATTPEEGVAAVRQTDTIFRYFGRTRLLSTVGAELIGSSSSVRFRAQGDTAWVDLEVPGEAHAYALITLNDKLSWKYRLSGGKKVSLAVPLGGGQQWNELGVYKLTEAVNGEVLFHGARADGLRRSTYEPELHIEFIGDSMTCGYGMDQDQIPCDSETYYDQHNPYEAYAAKAARTMGAGYALSAVSGVGMYRNYGESDILTMPERYTSLGLDGKNQGSWPPEGWDPDIVSICLGTNDLNAVRDGAPAEFDAEEFTRDYIAFVESLRTMYPSAVFVLLDSPMLNETRGEELKASLEKVREHFSDALVIRVMHFDGVGLSGCEQHPGIQDHDAMARQVRSFFIKTLDEMVEEEDVTVS